MGESGSFRSAGRTRRGRARPGPVECIRSWNDSKKPIQVRVRLTRPPKFIALASERDGFGYRVDPARLDRRAVCTRRCVESFRLLLLSFYLWRCIVCGIILDKRLRLSGTAVQMRIRRWSRGVQNGGKLVGKKNKTKMGKAHLLAKTNKNGQNVQKTQMDREGLIAWGKPKKRGKCQNRHNMGKTSKLTKTWAKFKNQTWAKSGANHNKKVTLRTRVPIWRFVFLGRNERVAAVGLVLVVSIPFPCRSIHPAGSIRRMNSHSFSVEERRIGPKEGWNSSRVRDCLKKQKTCSVSVSVPMSVTVLMPYHYWSVHQKDDKLLYY